MVRVLFPLVGAALAATLVSAQEVVVQPFPMDPTAETRLRPDTGRLRALAGFEQVQMTGVPLPDGQSVDVRLERIDVERFGFRFQVDGAPREDLLRELDLSLWKGHVVGEPHSEVRLSFSRVGSRGWISRPASADGTVHLLPQPSANGSWEGGEVLLTSDGELARKGSTLGAFCQTEMFDDQGQPRFDPQHVRGLPATENAGAAEGVADCNLFECSVAIETDYQLFQLFNDLAAETAYITTLLGFVSDRFEEQAHTLLTFPYVMFYTTPDDPWLTPECTACTAYDMLYELETVWYGSIPAGATLGHFVSGANLGGGIAYLDVLGNPYFGLAVSANINGNVNFPVVQQPSNWDFVVIAHELGHNFSAPHTHDLCPPIDQCPPLAYAGQCQTEQVCRQDGSIMSYCHLCSGGTWNITTWFHPEMAARMEAAATQALSPAFAMVHGREVAQVGENTTTAVAARPFGDLSVENVLVHYRYDDGPFHATALSLDQDGQYSGFLPAADCGDAVEYYYSFATTGCGVGTDPLDAPDVTYSAGVGTPIPVLADDFESDTGWTTESLAEHGDWERGVPVGDPEWVYAPAADYHGSGQCYLTDNAAGNSDVDGGAVRLISPTMDSSAGGFTLMYAYYLELDFEDGVDALVVEWSSDGDDGPWIEVARHETRSGRWRHAWITPQELVDAGADWSSNTKVRFTANDDGSTGIVEAAIDAFQLSRIECQDGGATQYCVASPHSAGSGAVISSFGSANLSGNGFVLVTGNAIPGGTGLFYYGPEQIQAPFGDGVRCVGGPVARLYPLLTADGSGSVLRTLDFASPPASAGSHEITAGSTWNFQYWFRDAAADGAGFNLSNGLSVTFLP